MKQLKYTKVIDLSGEFYNGMWTYQELIPEIMRFESSVFATISNNGFESSNIKLCSISGTYLETAAHQVKNARKISDISPDSCVFDAYRISIPKKARGVIKDTDIDLSDIPKRSALIFVTCYGKNWYSSDFVKGSPFFTLAAMRKIMEASPVLVGGDIPLFDDYLAPAGVNQLIFDSDCLMLAPLVNCGSLPKRFTLLAAPLKIRDCTASPVRALAFV